MSARRVNKQLLAIWTLKGDTCQCFVYSKINECRFNMLTEISFSLIHTVTIKSSVPLAIQREDSVPVHEMHLNCHTLEEVHKTTAAERRCQDTDFCLTAWTVSCCLQTVCFLSVFQLLTPQGKICCSWWCFFFFCYWEINWIRLLLDQFCLCYIS